MAVDPQKDKFLLCGMGERLLPAPMVAADTSALFMQIWTHFLGAGHTGLNPGPLCQMTVNHAAISSPRNRRTRFWGELKQQQQTSSFHLPRTPASWAPGAGHLVAGPARTEAN